LSFLWLCSRRNTPTVIEIRSCGCRCRARYFGSTPHRFPCPGIVPGRYPSWTSPRACRKSRLDEIVRLGCSPGSETNGTRGDAERFQLPFELYASRWSRDRRAWCCNINRLRRVVGQLFIVAHTCTIICCRANHENGLRRRCVRTRFWNTTRDNDYYDDD